ncbi:MAG: hypothetical protein HC836_26165 [Richelia sp. RM2_1_2]|nr:hypothetical protein [Richelia sp. RM2_1_2]
MTTDGAGVLSWTTITGISGGSGTIEQITSTSSPIVVTAPTGPNTTLAFTINGLTEEPLPLPSDWVIIQKAGDGSFRKAQTQNLPGGGGGVISSSSLNRALVYKTSSQSITSGTPTIITWPTLQTQTPTTWWVTSPNTRLTVPAGITKIRVQVGLAFSAASAGTILVSVKRTTTAPTTVGNIVASLDPRQSSFEKGIYLASPILDVIPGDYFEVEVLQTSGSSISVIPIAAGPDGTADPGKFSTYFAIEEASAGVQNLVDLADVNISSPGVGQDNFALTWDNTSSTFILSEITGGNLGTGADVFKSRTDTTLNFRTLLESGSVITITENTNDITFATPGIRFSATSVTPATGTGTNSIAIGSGASTSTFNTAIAIGNGVISPENLTVKIGTSNTTYFMLDASGSLQVPGATANNARVRIGKTDGSPAATPVLDFNSSGTSSSYDTRIESSGGTSTFGQGTLRFRAGEIDINNVNMINVLTPTASSNPATKGYIDGLSSIKYVDVNSTSTGAVATGSDAIAIGENAIASNLETIAIGDTCSATGSGSIAIGNNVTNSTNNSFTIGSNDYNLRYKLDGTLTMYREVGSFVTIQTAGSATDIDIKINPGGVNGAVDMTNSSVINVLDPVNPQDAATKTYVDTRALDNLTDVFIGTTQPGALFSNFGAFWQQNNRLLYINNTGTETTHELEVNHPFIADPNGTGTIAVRLKSRFDATSGTPGRCQVQATVTKGTHIAQVQVIRDGGVSTASTNIAAGLTTVASTRTIALQVYDPNASFSTIASIIIDADNAGINMGGLRMSNVQVVTQADTTPNRPALPSIGQTYFDTTLSRPIWWDGSNWINAVGTAV